MSCNNTHYHGMIDAPPEILDNYKGKKGFFIKKFLISDKFNLNAWRVTWAAILLDVKSFIGKPVVLTPNEDHPSVANQDNYKIGEIIDVGIDEDTHKAWQVSIITDKNAQELIRTKKVRYGSPTVHALLQDVELRNEGTAAEETIMHRFAGKHDAIVSEPAYSKMIDKISAICEGDGEACASKLLKVQADVNDNNTNQIIITPFMKRIKKLDKEIKITKLKSDITRLETKLSK